jgi:hypothetical protein
MPRGFDFADNRTEADPAHRDRDDGIPAGSEFLPRSKGILAESIVCRREPLQPSGFRRIGKCAEARGCGNPSPIPEEMRSQPRTKALVRRSCPIVDVGCIP